MLRVLGIDPGSRYLGFGLVEQRRRTARSELLHIGHGVVVTNPAQPLAMRLRQLHEALEDVVATFKPDVVAVEGVFTHKNARSALILGHARGIALLIAAQAGLAVHEYAPARVKKSVGAGGNDGKGSVARMVTMLLRLTQPLERSDAYDALAVAICHLHTSGGAVAGASLPGPSKGSDFARRLTPSYVKPEARP